MNELIKVTNDNGEQLVSARELHDFLGSKQDFTTWIKGRIEKYDFVENVDYTLHKFMEGKNWKHDYIIKLDMAKELSMVENNDKGKEARRYFIACEKRLKEVAQPKLPQTYLEALKELVRIEEEKLQLENQVNRLVHSKKLYTTTEIAKELGIKSAAEFNKLLAKDKIQYNVNKTWVLTSKYADKDYVSIKQTELDNGKIIYDRKWTGLGREFLLNRYKEVE